MTVRNGRGISRRDMIEGLAAAGAIGLVPASVRAADAVPRGRPFPLIVDGQPAAIWVDPAADPAIRRVADSFAQDLQRVSGSAPARFADKADLRGLAVVLIGALSQCAIIDRLVAEGRIDVADIEGEWEAFRQITVDDPFPGVAQALVIVGADRRGAVFGTYDISERIGVSPWHWFADVPVRRQRDVSLPGGSRRDQPGVRYRGFFINDEEPCFAGWARRKFGGINSKMYEHVFELLLRMKGNYLWPAMWLPKAFAEDDPQNMVLADAMGVVMGNSHHEPMLRAQHEWHRNKEQGVTGGKWDYAANGENLRKFWRGGIERMMAKGDGKGYESLVTIGMRGDGDEAMREGTAIPLLERIVADQRAIIADVTGKPASETPQIWALYKEVQDYYDHGMEVPDDVTLLFADDNWGQIRRLPKPGGKPRKGGYGVYYHFDYVGGPRNYKWLNTNQIEKVWQQMDLAWQRGARAAWIVNVGDIKPMEYPLGFFMAMAWNPDAFTPEAVAAYPARWAGATFGAALGREIGDLVTRYSKFSAWRKPELIDADSFPLGGVGPDWLDGGEFGQMVAAWDALEWDMLAVRARLAPDQYDAWFQLIEHPISALANLYRLYYAAAWNRLLADRNDARANHFADMVEAAYARDGAITDAYHRMGGGKWDGMMDQIHMGYTTWQVPERQVMPPVRRVAAPEPAPAIRYAAPAPVDPGIIAIEAASFTRARHGRSLRWTPIADLGRTRGAVLALPQGQGATSISDAVWLEYALEVKRPGPARIELFLAPTLDTLGTGGSRIGVSLDDGPVQELTIRLIPTGEATDTPDTQRWAQAVSDNIVRISADMGDVSAGPHRIRVWRLDDNMVLERLVLSTVPVPQTYLGAGAFS